MDTKKSVFVLTFVKILSIFSILLTFFKGIYYLLTLDNFKYLSIVFVLFTIILLFLHFKKKVVPFFITFLVSLIINLILFFIYFLISLNSLIAFFDLFFVILFINGIFHIQINKHKVDYREKSNLFVFSNLLLLVFYSLIYHSFQEKILMEKNSLIQEIYESYNEESNNYSFSQIRNYTKCFYYKFKIRYKTIDNFPLPQNYNDTDKAELFDCVVENFVIDSLRDKIRNNKKYYMNKYFEQALDLP